MAIKSSVHPPEGQLLFFILESIDNQRNAEDGKDQHLVCPVVWLEVVKRFVWVNREKILAFRAALHHFLDVVIHLRPVNRITSAAASFFDPLVSVVKVIQYFLLLLGGGDSPECSLIDAM